MNYVIRLIAITVLLFWSGHTFAADIGGPDAQKELQKFQGAWVMDSGEMDGKKAVDEHVKSSKIIFNGTNVQIIVPNQTSETIVAEIVKLDPTKNPKEMHFVRKNGPNAGKELIGIYEFEAPDRYKFAFDPAGKTKLKEFVTKPGTGHVRNTWKRAKQ